MNNTKYIFLYYLFFLAILFTISAEENNNQNLNTEKSALDNSTYPKELSEDRDILTIDNIQNESIKELVNHNQKQDILIKNNKDKIIDEATIRKIIQEDINKSLLWASYAIIALAGVMIIRIIIQEIRS